MPEFDFKAWNRTHKCIVDGWAYEIPDVWFMSHPEISPDHAVWLWHAQMQMAREYEAQSAAQGGN